MKGFNGLIIYNTLVVKLLSFGFASGITVWPLIFIQEKYKTSEVILNHERIHIRQQLETLLLGFFIIYLFQYLLYRLNNNHIDAYKKISFEREAYQFETDLGYLKKRKLFAWLRL